MTKELPKFILIKNPDRQKNVRVEPPRPEYQKMERYPAGFDAKQGKYKSTVIVKHEHQKLMKDFIMNNKKNQVPPALPNVGNVSGFSEDQSWNNPEAVAVEEQPFEFNMVGEDPNQEIFEPDEVDTSTDPPTNSEGPVFALLHRIPAHSILLVVRDEGFFCSSLEEVEEQVEHLVFQEKIPLGEISVIYKPELSVGTYVKSKI